jgi:hypothetical protein
MVTMRTMLFPLVLGAMAATVTVKAAPAAADNKTDVVGTYDVKYDEVSNNCTDVGITFGRGTLAIDNRKGTLVVDIERVPLMNGATPHGGKLRAQSKLGPSSIQGLDGKFSVAGRVDNGVLQLVFVAEYYVKTKPLCTQSWNISGLRQTPAAKASTEPEIGRGDAVVPASAWPF